ncbi:MAG: hypothetical protein LQ342_001719 [Letrouitia transgressa]|nr:MAG: hypothetical protein LQ342_001719 [Letrouitia transgressa]
MATVATYRVPKVENESNKHYVKGSAERKGLEAAILKYKHTHEIPKIANGRELKTEGTGPSKQIDPSDHTRSVCKYHNGTAREVAGAIDLALKAKPSWESLPFADRAAVFLKAADLISSKYRYDVMAATMVGQGKNAWQAEIDAAAELCDFFR